MYNSLNSGLRHPEKMNYTELDHYLEIINNVLLKSAVKINKWREKFMLEILFLYLIEVSQVLYIIRVRQELNYAHY